MARLANIFARLYEQFGAWFSRTFIIALLAFLFLVALGGISHNNKWQIVRVDVTGANTVSLDAVRSLALEKILGNYFLVYARNNSYLFPVGEIEQSLLGAFPRIESVSVKRIDDHSIMIDLSERKPYALWCGLPATDYRSNEAVGRFQAGEDAELTQVPEQSSLRGAARTDAEVARRNVELSDCWFIDGAGFVFDRAPVFSSGVYLEVYAKLVEKNTGVPLRSTLPYSRFAATNTFVELLQKKVGEPLRVSLKSDGDAEIVFRASATYPFLAGVIVRFKDEESPAVLVKTLLAAVSREFPDNVALKKKLLYIDMRFGNKIFFGFEQ